MAVKQPFLRLALKHSAPKFRLFGATLLLALSDCESEAKNDGERSAGARVERDCRR